MRRDAWEAFAAREPYFAVLADSRFLRKHFDTATEAEFFKAGDDHVARLLQFIREHASPLYDPKTVLEYGCGVGRLLVPFARRTVHAVGVDISKSMLAVARQQVARAGLTNVELIESVTFESDPRRFDLVNCYLVLQRMPPSRGLELLRSLGARVREGGVGVFHLPFRSHASAAVRWSRWVRARVPAVNALFTTALRKQVSTPMVETHLYDLNDAFALLQGLGFEAPLVLYARHGDLDGVIIHAQRGHVFDEPEPAAPPRPEPVREAGFIDVRKLIAETSIDELNRTAEGYFASLRDWNDHLAKPFARIQDTPQLLIGAGVLVQGLSLVQGLTVLEYGAGTGWLSRYLTQLGCRTILLDVSATALNMARELFAKHPVFGERPEPAFLAFDGRTIELPDASVDRIVCFDAFHHAPNPEAVLAEFKRVLRPGGIAGFLEPGPWHSTTPQSQFEMRTYGVVENDVDIHALWAEAQKLGFTDLHLAAFNVPPFHVSLTEFDELLAAGDAFARWAQATRMFMTATRCFFLRTTGTEAVDSRNPVGLRAEIAMEVPPRVGTGEAIPVHATVRNTGAATWLPSGPDVGAVSLGLHLYDGGGRLIDFDFRWESLPRALAPDESLSLDFTLDPLAPGRYILELDCVASKVAWFAQLESPAARVDIVVEG